jgi:hypothetical protein
LKPLSNGCLGIIIKINLTTNYQLLLNCNKVHRARLYNIDFKFIHIVFLLHCKEATTFREAIRNIEFKCYCKKERKNIGNLIK